MTNLWSTKIRIGSLHFQAGCCNRQSNFNFLERIAMLASQCLHCKRCTSYSNSVCLSVLKMGTKYLNLLSCGQFQQYRTKSLLQSFIGVYKNCQRQSCSAVHCLSSGINILARGRPLTPEILAPSDLHSPEGSEFSHILPCSASTARDRKRSSTTFNKNSTRAFQWAINQGSTPPLTSSKWV